jgi:hypothetical protein
MSRILILLSLAAVLATPTYAAEDPRGPAQSHAAATLITLDMKDAPLEDVLNAIGKQAHTGFRDTWPADLWDRRRKKPVTLKAEQQPYWAVFKELLPQVGLQLTGGRPRLMDGPPEIAGPSSLFGAFLVVATDASDARKVRYVPRSYQRAEESEAQVRLDVYYEPKIRVISERFEPTIDEFVDDAGHSLKVPKERDDFEDDKPFEPVSEIHIPVADVEGRSRRVAKLKGSLHSVLETKSGTVELKDVMKAKGSSGTQGDWTLTVKDIAAQTKSGKEGYALILTLRSSAVRHGGARLPEYRRIPECRRLWLRDSEGRDFDKHCEGMKRDGKDWVGTFRFTRAKGNPVGEPATLAWEIPVEAEEVQIPFELNDLRLP